MSSKNDNLKNVNNYAKYSGVAFEMLGIIVFGVWGGIRLDARLGTKPLLSVVLALAAVAAAMYLIIVRTREKD
ncbi:MAG: AtpZ/AtpI family protein [Salinivirgaceae bacterium]|nr:AtpZ/AtpI family protein [Salinivirgaceae bacterium]